MKLTHTDDSYKVDSVVKVDKLADAARTRIAGDAARVKEYELAAQEATSYKEAGYKGSTPPSVLSWAEAKGWTGQQAADDILAASGRFYAALYAVRDLRLKAKEAIKSAKTYMEVETLFNNFQAEIEKIMQGM